MDKKDLANAHSFEIKYEAPSGETFSGKFSVHRATVGERIKIGVNEARELGGMINVDMMTSNIAHILATLEVVIDSAPAWWKPRELTELEVMQVVYDKYIDYLREFQGEVSKKPETTG